MKHFRLVSYREALDYVLAISQIPFVGERAAWKVSTDKAMERKYNSKKEGINFSINKIMVMRNTDFLINRFIGYGAGMAFLESILRYSP